MPFVVVICPRCGGRYANCVDCGGTGSVSVGMSGTVKLRASPCCNAPWRTAKALAVWICTACGKKYDRSEVAEEGG